MEKFALIKPLLINGANLNELQYDFDGLTAADMERAGKMLKDAGSYVNVVELDAGYHYKIFCVSVTKHNPDVTMLDMDRLGGKDYFAAIRITRNFFIGSSEELSLESTEGG